MIEDDSWVVGKQIDYLRDAIEARRISIELLECLSVLTKEVMAHIGPQSRENIAHLTQRARYLLEESSAITDIVLTPTKRIVTDLPTKRRSDVTFRRVTDSSRHLA